MRRREFILIAGGTALASTVSTRAQQAGPLPVMGLLTLADLPDWALGAIREGLGEAGFVEGRNLSILVRSAEAHFDRLPALAAELVKSQVSVIFATGSPVPARTAKLATSTIPIVFAYGGDPVAKMTETWLFTSSAASAGKRSNWFSAERRTTIRFRPST